jgi:hypothetical protein
MNNFEGHLGFRVNFSEPIVDVCTLSREIMRLSAHFSCMTEANQILTRYKPGIDQNVYQISTR